MRNISVYQEIFNLPYCKDFLNYKTQGIEIFDLILCIPTAAFLIFLLVFLRSSIRKLFETESLIMSTYYGFLWGVCLFNIARCLLNYFLKNSVIYEILFLVSNFILVFVEVSVVVFMSHGYMVSGREAIHRTVILTTIICLVYLGIQAGVMFGGKIDLFVKNQISKPANMYWFVINTIFAIVYFIILILPKTSLKERLPARPSFYHYVGFLFGLNLTRAVGEIIVFGGLAIGYCFIDVGILAYYSLYVPILYVCFMRDFFKDVTLPDGFVEMNKSGYLDTDT